MVSNNICSAALLLAGAVIALPSESMNMDNFKSTPGTELIKVNAKNSDLACRWGLFPKWSLAFGKAFPNVEKPAFSSISDLTPDYNKAGQVVFDCFDKRIEGKTLPTGEVKMRGPFIDYCDKGEVVVTWPLDLAAASDNSLFSHHRSVCAKAGKPENIWIDAGTKQCRTYKAPDVSMRVLTVYVTDVNLSGQKYPYAITISWQAVGGGTVASKKFASSVSTKVSPETEYQVCVDTGESAFGLKPVILPRVAILVPSVNPEPWLE